MVLSLNGSSEDQFRALWFGQIGSLVRSERTILFVEAVNGAD
jgi:hypothetical protein